ncbi:MAG: TIGR03084 family metal-binding protein [Acidimicrobiia bacterium]
MSAVDHPALVADLADEEDALDRIVDGLDPAGWAAPTVAAGWDVRATVAHLAGAEALAATALTEPDAFADRLAGMRSAGVDVLQADAVLARWHVERVRVLDALAAASPRDRFPWIAGDMSAVSFATSRLMETWAHGSDVAAALGLPYPATARLRHVAELGVRTRPFAFGAHRVPLPAGDVRVELVGPEGEVWTWGASDGDTVRGTALDFCLVVTQRRHVDDSVLTVEGPFARQWMVIAQAFAGRATTARRA